MQLGLHVLLLTVGAGDVSDTAACLRDPFPPTGLPSLAPIGEVVPSLVAT